MFGLLIPPGVAADKAEAIEGFVQYLYDVGLCLAEAEEDGRPPRAMTEDEAMRELAQYLVHEMR